MKKYISFPVVFALCCIISITISAKKIPPVQKFHYEVYENNLLEGIKTENTGVKVSSAIKLGEIKSEKAVIPLISVLRNAKCEKERLSAALALTQIGTAKALYFVKSAARFDDSPRVREVCHKFYVNSVMETKK